MRDTPPTLTLEAVLEGHTAPVRALAFSPDGAALASGGDDRIARVWHLPGGESRIGRWHAGPVTRLAVSRGGRALASRGPKDGCQLWNVDDKKPVRVLGGGDAPLAFLPDGDTIAVAVDYRTVLFWDAPTGRFRGGIDLEEWSRYADQHTPEALAVSPDGATLATGSGHIGWDRGGTSHQSVRFWDAQSGRLERTVQNRTPPMHALVFSPDGSMLAARSPSGYEPKEVHVWDVETARPVADLAISGAEALAFSPDGALAVGALRPDGGRRVAEMGLADLRRGSPAGSGAGRESLSWTPPITRCSQSGLPAMAFSPDGRRLAVGGDVDDHAVRVWRVDYATTVARHGTSAL